MQSSSNRDAEGGVGLLVLIVEDDDSVTKAFERALHQEGYSTWRVRHGIEALNWLRTNAILPRLIVFDLLMPVMNGWNFHANLRSKAVWSEIPAIAVSGLPLEDMSSSLPGVVCFGKPMSMAELMGAVKKALGRSEAPTAN